MIQQQPKKTAKECLQECAKTKQFVVIRKRSEFQMPLVECLNKKECEHKIDNRTRKICGAVWDS